MFSIVSLECSYCEMCISLRHLTISLLIEYRVKGSINVVSKLLVFLRLLVLNYLNFWEALNFWRPCVSQMLKKIKECKFEKNQQLTKSISFLIDWISTSSELLNSLFSFLHHWYITSEYKALSIITFIYISVHLKWF